MSEFRPNDPLLMAGKIISLLAQGVMAIAAIALAITLPVVLFMQDTINLEIAKEHGGTVDPLPVLAIGIVIALALAGVVLLFVFFGKLRQIIATVGEGDPFVPENADRLSAMAWIMLGIYLLGIPIAAAGVTVANWAKTIEGVHVASGISFDASSILLVVVLFILARVFRHGAAMREDLEGTV
ncbi:MAG: DUF2975 domain-containing protein [Sphingomonadaceae bacterium]|nr:DUF2975 domain-containing protein [Sphingomonadaceae bacterium]